MRSFPRRPRAGAATSTPSPDPEAKALPVEEEISLLFSVFEAWDLSLPRGDEKVLGGRGPALPVKLCEATGDWHLEEARVEEVAQSWLRTELRGCGCLECLPKGKLL